MTGVEVLDGVEHQRSVIATTGAADRGEHEPGVIAESDPRLDASDQPCGCVVEHGHIVDLRVPATLIELVGPVTALLTEQASQILLIRSQLMHADVPGSARQASSRVGLRDADQEPRRVDAAPGGESHQDSAPLATTTSSDDKH